MGFLADLWMPILASAVAVFVISSLVHMVFQIHKGDHGSLPDEEAVLDAIRRAAPAPGSYTFPGCSSMKEMGTPEMQAKYQRGPVGFLTLLPNGPCAIGKNLLQWFLLSLAISVLAAYVSFHALPRGASAAAVIRIAASVAIAGYAFGAVQDSIWKGVPWRVSWKYFLDGVAYGLATGVVLGMMWPA